MDILQMATEIILWNYLTFYNCGFSSGLPHFYGKISGHVVRYRNKDKNTTQGNLAELVGSPVAPIWCK